MEPGKKIYDAIIIGAGPAGLMAAIRAGSRGRSVLVIEKNDMPGKKLLISGKGKCNLTNAGESPDEFLDNFSPSGKFLRNAFHAFSNLDLMDFFISNGLKLKTERGKRVFPESGSARDILGFLIKKMKESRAELIINTDVTFSEKGKTFIVRAAGKKEFFASSLLIATGGKSYPVTGSTGAGYRIAQTFGHTIIEPRPALVGVNSSEVPKSWQGISLKNVACSVISGEKNAAREFGEMLFTHWGMSGPIILDLSAKVYDELSLGKKVYISIDLKPALDAKTLGDRVLREFDENRAKNIDTVLKNLMPGSMAGDFAGACGLKSEDKIYRIKRESREMIVKRLKDYRFRIGSARPLDEAIVTRGGVSTKEINPKTMESRLVPGLFFAGEVIDVDAKTGGYNLQAAFSTGAVAGDNL